MNDSITVRTWKASHDAAQEIEEQNKKLTDWTDIDIATDDKVADFTDMDISSRWEARATRQQYVVTVTRVTTYVADSITIESKEPTNDNS